MSGQARPDIATGSSTSPGTGEAHDSVAVLEQGLWRNLALASTTAEFARAWLELACRTVAGTAAAALWIRIGDGPVEHYVWPANAAVDPALAAAAARMDAEARGTVQPGATPQRPTRLAYPAVIDGRTVGGIAMDVTPAPGRDARQSMRQLQWATAWVRDHVRAADGAVQRDATERMGLAITVMAAALEEETVASACRVATTELATRLDCERVSLGFVERGHSRIAGISHSAAFGKAMTLVKMLGHCMDEAIDQRSVVLYPAPADQETMLTRAHEALAVTHGSTFILTVPMFVKDRFVGAVAFERSAGRPFDQSTIDIADAVVAILGPALLDKRDNDRTLPAKAWLSVVQQVRWTLGPGHIGRKLMLLAMVAVLLFGRFATGPYRIVADGKLEGAVQRSIVAPFDGFISEAPVRAGDVVHTGDTMVAFDNRDLVLERLRWAAERQQKVYEYDQALSERKRADANRIQAEMSQADAQIRLVDAQLDRSRIVAPFDGLVVSGDLSQQIGAAVRRGYVMLQLAPLEGYRVELQVHESQIDQVQAGQQGQVVISALPDGAFSLVVERVTPVAVAHDGRTFFKVDARLEQASPRLRPGMDGVGKIDAGDHRLVWIWFRSLLHWARVTSWKWIP